MQNIITHISTTSHKKRAKFEWEACIKPRNYFPSPDNNCAFGLQQEWEIREHKEGSFLSSTASHNPGMGEAKHIDTTIEPLQRSQGISFSPAHNSLVRHSQYVQAVHLSYLPQVREPREEAIGLDSIQITALGLH